MSITKFTIQKYDNSQNWDVSELCSDVSWSTDMDFSAGSLEFTLKEVDEGFTPWNGDFVEFQWDNQKIFKGRIFIVDYDSKENWKCTAYDDLYYLKSEDTIVFNTSTALERFIQIMKIRQQSYKVISEQTAKLASEVFDGETYFSMIKKSADKIYTQVGNRYMIYDDYGTITWVRAYGSAGSDTETGLLFGDDSNATDWSLSRSVDSLYNVVKVVREDEDDKQRKTYTTKTANSTASIERYGRLQKVENAESKANVAQMQNQAIQTLNELNREERTLSITVIGDYHVRAGSIFSIYMKSLNDIGIGQRKVCATKVKHSFGTNWTMDIEGVFV